jgi:ABC-2 type transport system permease protein
MFAIGFKEFKNLFKSFKSLVVISIIFGVTLGSAKLISIFQSQLHQLGMNDSPYATGLLIIILLASPLFIFALSHNAINEEYRSRTIRFIATKTSRENIIFGKFFGTLFFWIVCLTIVVILLTFFSGHFYFSELIQSIIYVSYFIGLTILLSTVISRPGITGFLGIVLSIAVTIIGLWSIGSKNLLLKIFSYITPYFFYSQDNENYTYLVLIFPILFLGLSLMILRRRDL